MKSVRIRSFSGPYFLTFGLNTERYGVSLHMQSECGKIQTRKTPNTNTFHAVNRSLSIIVAESNIPNRSRYSLVFYKKTVLKV